MAQTCQMLTDSGLASWVSCKCCCADDVGCFKAYSRFSGRTQKFQFAKEILQMKIFSGYDSSVSRTNTYLEEAVA